MYYPYKNRNPLYWFEWKHLIYKGKCFIYATLKTGHLYVYRQYTYIVGNIICICMSFRNRFLACFAASAN